MMKQICTNINFYSPLPNKCVMSVVSFCCSIILVKLISPPPQIMISNLRIWIHNVLQIMYSIVLKETFEIDVIMCRR